MYFTLKKNKAHILYLEDGKEGKRNLGKTEHVPMFKI